VSNPKPGDIVTVTMRDGEVLDKNGSAPEGYIWVRIPKHGPVQVPVDWVRVTKKNPRNENGHPKEVE